MAKGYTTKAAVAAYMGLAFTVAQNTQCDALIEDVEDYIDGETRRAWLTGAITDEIGIVRRDMDQSLGRIFTKNYPITSVASVKVRSRAFDATDTTLTANATSNGYQAFDLNSGLIYVPLSYKDYIARVTYTPVATIPHRLGLAATGIVAHWMQPAISPDTQGIESYSVGQDLTVKFRSSAGYSVPTKWGDIVASFRDRRPA